MKIRFIKSPIGFGLGYSAGEEGDFKESQAKELIESGFAEAVEKESKIETADKKTPEGVETPEVPKAHKKVK